MKTVFMGTPAFALPTLQKLHQSAHTVLAVVTQPDRPKGRGRALTPPPVKEYALAHGLPVIQPPKASAPEVVETLAGMQPDVIVVVAFGQLLRENLLTTPRYFCMNVHASLLPKYRGAAPINWALINGETETGVTTMHMDAGLDTGDILLMRRQVIEPHHTSEDLYGLLAETGGGLALETLDRLAAGTLTPVPQDGAQATLAPKLKKEDGWVHWDAPALTIHNRVRGLEPWPGAFALLRGKRLRLGKTEVGPGGNGDRPGVLARISEYGLEVGTRQGRLILTELQPEGKRRMDVKSFLAGHRLETGERFDSPPTGRPAA
ncbi:MAG: methionyl-tRNA formyltransferase [Nitrospinaceae bacterium]